MSVLDDKKISALAADVITLARNLISVEMRFMNSAISMLRLEEYSGSIFTDGNAVYYDPVYVLRAYKTAKQFPPRFFLHSLMHCIFRHWFIDVGANREIWDISCDIAAENLINELNISAVQIPQCNAQTEYTDTLKKQLKLLTAEKIYGYYCENNLSENELERLKKLFSFDEHTPWYTKNVDLVRVGSEGSRDGNGEGKKSAHSGIGTTELNAMWKDISENMQTELETFGKQRGNKAGNLVQHLSALNRERYDYSEFLKKFAVMGEVMNVNDDEFDYIFYTYGMQLYDRMPLIEPLEYKDEKRIREFAIAIDTSGSVSGELVQKFVQKSYNILKSEESFFKKINLHIIQCDTEIQQDVKITSQEEFDRYISEMKLFGFGGTDFRPVFSYIDELIDKKEFTNLRGLIYFTDGFGIFPSRQPAYNTAVVYVDDDYNNPDVPVWAIKLVLQRNEI